MKWPLVLKPPKGARNKVVFFIKEFMKIKGKADIIQITDITDSYLFLSLTDKASFCNIVIFYAKKIILYPSVCRNFTCK